MRLCDGLCANLRLACQQAFKIHFNTKYTNEYLKEVTLIGGVANKSLRKRNVATVDVSPSLRGICAACSAEKNTIENRPSAVSSVQHSIKIHMVDTRHCW